MRLLSDPAFCEEFDIIVDEISIRYVAGGFEGDEKDLVEHYFLAAPERQNKVRIMCELLHHSAITRGEKAPATATADKTESSTIDSDSGWLARLRRFWRNQPLMFRFATTVAALVIVAGLVFLARSGRPTPTNYATLTLTAIDAERGQQVGADAVGSVKLDGVGDLPVRLLLSPQPTQPKSYRAELIIPGTTQAQNLTVTSHDSNSVTVSVPTAQLKRDRYAIRLFAIAANGQEERVRGSYLFRVE